MVSKPVLLRDSYALLLKTLLHKTLLLCHFTICPPPLCTHELGFPIPDTSTNKNQGDVNGSLPRALQKDHLIQLGGLSQPKDFDHCCCF